jgi:hypothetical protein
LATFGATNFIWRWWAGRYFRRIARTVGCSVNNYDNHGGGQAPQLRSADFWDARGRGFFIDRKKAHQVMRIVRANERRHPWLYMIYWDTGYLPNGETFVPFGGDAWNAGHVHVSLARRR